jgi:hypothetical protein
MTYEEKIVMYKNKKAFIDNVSKAFETLPHICSVESVDYEVYTRKIIINNEPKDHFVEYLVVHFIGGGKSVKITSGNSNTANFRILGTMIDGGYYDENREYDSLAEKGFTKINLNKPKLDELLSNPMTHISDVRKCFNYCKDGNDVEKVIEMIPTVFGSFEADFKDSEEAGTFVIFNEWYTEDGPESEYSEYEFYTED